MEIKGRYYLSDIESGDWYEVSKEYHDSYIEHFKNQMKKISEKSNYKGIIIVGGSGSLEKNSFKDIWDKK